MSEKCKNLKIYSELLENNGRIEIYGKFYIRKGLNDIFLEKVIFLYFFQLEGGPP